MPAGEALKGTHDSRSEDAISTLDELDELGERGTI